MPTISEMSKDSNDESAKRKRTKSEAKVQGIIENTLKSAISKDRTRFKEGDVNLDLTYITNNLVAMAFPASGVEYVVHRN